MSPELPNLPHESNAEQETMVDFLVITDRVCRNRFSELLAKALFFHLVHMVYIYIYIPFLLSSGRSVHTIAENMYAAALLTR